MRLAPALDLSLRLAFFATAPLLLVFVAALFPMTGALVQIGFTLLVFFAAEAVRDVAARSKLAKWILSSQLEFEAYYRQHPPRSILYYAFYPLLFPYWLRVPEARRELLLYSGYTLASFALLLGSLVVQYLTLYPPELGLGDFLPLAAGTFAVQTLAVWMFLMPIVTSVVHYHLVKAPGRLAILLVVGILPISFAVWRLERRRDPLVSFATRTRVRERTEAAARAARSAQTHALLDAWKALPKDREDIDSDGKVEGLALDAAHDSLGSFYKNDEAHAFDLWLTRKGKSAILVVYFEARRGHAPIWLAMDRSHSVITDPARLPKGAFQAMWRATQ